MADIRMAKHYLAERLAQWQVEGEFARLQDGARKLVRKSWARRRIRRLAGNLLVYGTLDADQIRFLTT